jgi:hypothetical protein
VSQSHAARPDRSKKTNTAEFVGARFFRSIRSRQSACDAGRPVES